jgi:hypothetical protein
MSAPQIPQRPAKIIVDQIMNRIPVRPVIFPVYRKKEIPARVPIFPVYRTKIESRLDVIPRIPIFPVYRKEEVEEAVEEAAVEEAAEYAIGEKEIKDYLSSIYSSIPETTTSKWLREKCEEHFQVKIIMESKKFHKIFREVDEEN